MAKVDWITWKTDPKEIINPEKVSEKIMGMFTDYNVYMNSTVYEGLRYELLNGGLDKLSLDIMGTTPAHDKAQSILKNIDDIKVSLEDLKTTVFNNAKEQKEIEKKQLVLALEEKIKEIDTLISNEENDLLTNMKNHLLEKIEITKAL